MILASVLASSDVARAAPLAERGPALGEFRSTLFAPSDCRSSATIGRLDSVKQVYSFAVGSCNRPVRALRVTSQLSGNGVDVDDSLCEPSGGVSYCKSPESRLSNPPGTQTFCVLATVVKVEFGGSPPEETRESRKCIEA